MPKNQIYCLNQSCPKLTVPNMPFPQEKKSVLGCLCPGTCSMFQNVAKVYQQFHKKRRRGARGGRYNNGSRQTQSSSWSWRREGRALIFFFYPVLICSPRSPKSLFFGLEEKRRLLAGPFPGQPHYKKNKRKSGFLQNKRKKLSNISISFFSFRFTAHFFPNLFFYDIKIFGRGFFWNL